MPAAVSAALILKITSIHCHGYLLIMKQSLILCILIIVFINYLTSRD